MLVLVRRLRSGFRKPVFVLVWLVPVWLLLNLCWMLVRVVPFRQLASLLGVAYGTHACIPLVTEDKLLLASKIGQVVRLAARYVPWGANCYPQALAACLMLVLYRVPHCLCFGVARNSRSQAFSAHAWVSAGTVTVIGGDSFSRYTVLACFVRLPGPARRRHNNQQAGDQPSLSAAPSPGALAGDGTRNP